jgi:hypothetical protein
MALFFVMFALWPDPVDAWGETGSRRNDSGLCPNDTESTIVFSPFTPYWKFDMFKGSVQNCWVATDCLFENSGESRKQQFASTALVMGLIPITIKDIAWPERRLIYVTRKLHWMIEVLVLALGLVPMETKNPGATRRKGCEGTQIAAYGWAMRKSAVKFWICICAVAVFVCYGSLAIMEVYSKRSALGCTAPITVVAWHIIAILPAGIHSFFASRRRQRFQRKRFLLRASLQSLSDGPSRPHNDPLEPPPSQQPKLLQRAQHLDIHDEPDDAENVDGNDEHEERKDREKKIVSAVQGADQDWPVQMAWGVYYIAGTLIFTSIMAVTVPELTVWVILGLSTTGCSKILAFFLCLAYEETGIQKEGRHGSIVTSREVDSTNAL